MLVINVDRFCFTLGGIMRESKLKKIFVIIFIIIVFILIGFTNGNNRKVTVIETLISELITLPQKGYIYAKNWITKDMDFFKKVFTKSCIKIFYYCLCWSVIIFRIYRDTFK